MPKSLTSWYRVPRISKGIYVCLALLVIAIPFLSSYSLVTFYLHKSLLQFIPSLSDEIYYWHEVATFRAVNFNGGYYTVNEQPAAASFTHFYTHGPVYPALFGSLAKVIGWQFNYVPILNIILLAFALGWFIWVTKPSYLQLALIALVLLTYWPTQLYMATNMLVVLFSTCAVVTAAFFYKLISESETASAWYWILLFVFITLLAIAQVSWALLFLPYAVLVRKKLHLSLPLALTAAVVLIAVCFLIAGQISAPYPNFPNQLLGTLKGSLYQGLCLFIQHVDDGIHNLLNFHQNPLWVMLRGEMLLLILGSGILLYKYRKDPASARENMVILTNCVLLLVEAILLYDLFDWRDYRLFAPIVLMATLIFVARKRISIVIPIVLLNLIVLPGFLTSYQFLIKDLFPQDRSAIEHFSEEIAPTIKYDENKGAWENTLLVPRYFVSNNLLLGVPAEIGISWFESPDKLTGIKSRYLLLDAENYEALQNQACLEFVRKTDLGNLYINQGAQCKK